MPYSVLAFSYRKPGTTPEQFRTSFEGDHIRLMRELTGSSFPLVHTIHFIHRTEQQQAEGTTTRNPNTPATVLIGAQEEFDYDAITEMTFEDEAGFKTFVAITKQPKNAARIAAEEDSWLDRARMTIVLKEDTAVRKRS
ncbi:EthD domain-containing protein [Nemania sp. FL0916]|nr:EthD domain-containing protein [Nemania sp. FL0916]